MLEVNFVAPLVLSRPFGSIMLAQRDGSIANVASIAGLVGVSDRTAYNASKHGLIGLTRTLAGEWGGRGIRVSAVRPGWVKTEMDVADQAGGGYTDDVITGRIPMARFARPDDIARAILFLADPSQSGFVNGQALAIDGGWTADGSWQSLPTPQALTAAPCSRNGLRVASISAWCSSCPPRTQRNTLPQFVRPHRPVQQSP